MRQLFFIGLENIINRFWICRKEVHSVGSHFCIFPAVPKIAVKILFIWMAAQARSFVQKKWNKLTSSNNNFVKIYKNDASIAGFENNANVKNILSGFFISFRINSEKITCKSICLHNLGQKRKWLSIVSNKQNLFLLFSSWLSDTENTLKWVLHI